MVDVITKLISTEDYRQGDAVVYQNSFLASSGNANLSSVQVYATLSGIHDNLTERFDDINYYSGSGVY